MMEMVRGIVCLVVIPLLLVYPAAYGQRPNVLFVVSDDLRPEIAAWQSDHTPWLNTQIHTPNLDSLASRSLLLRRAYTQYAICNPSRSSLMTGRRPDTTKVYDLNTYWRESGGNFTTLPQYFKEQGYYAAGLGKIYHPGPASGLDDPLSWSEPFFQPDDSMEGDNSWRSVPPTEREETPLPDDQIIEQALATMDRLANQEQPFFLAVGFKKPHLPYVFPEEFLQYYPEESVHLPNNRYVPVHMPDVAWYEMTEYKTYDDIAEIEGLGEINVTMPDSKTLELRRAYYASVSYMDAMVGVLLQKIEELGIAGNTIISFFGDHGYQLGENCEWGKVTNFEASNHVPMMIHVPGTTDSGFVVDEFTELVDLFPTIVEAAGLPTMDICPEDSSDITLCREGDSLFSLASDHKLQWKDAVFSQIHRRTSAFQESMGYSMRTQNYRYTEWPRWMNDEPQWDDLSGVELYDFQRDPEGSYNHAYQPGYEEIRQQLSERLREGWVPVQP